MHEADNICNRCLFHEAKESVNKCVIVCTKLKMIYTNLQILNGAENNSYESAVSARNRIICVFFHETDNLLYECIFVQVMRPKNKDDKPFM